MLTDASAHMVGCSLELSAATWKIAYGRQADDAMLHVRHENLMDHLFCWFRNSGAEDVICTFPGSLLVGTTAISTWRLNGVTSVC